MEFIVEKDQNISVEVADGDTALLFTFQVPSKAKMANIRFSNYINDFDAWGLIIWRLKRNGVAIYPYGEITDQIAVGAPLRELAMLEISGADTFQIYVTNDFIDPVKCGFALKFDIIQEK